MHLTQWSMGQVCTALLGLGWNWSVRDDREDHREKLV